MCPECIPGIAAMAAAATSTGALGAFFVRNFVRVVNIRVVNKKEDQSQNSEEKIRYEQQNHRSPENAASESGHAR
jgi:hypothetical protein